MTSLPAAALAFGVAGGCWVTAVSGVIAVSAALLLVACSACGTAAAVPACCRDWGKQYFVFTKF